MSDAMFDFFINLNSSQQDSIDPSDIKKVIEKIAN